MPIVAHNDLPTFGRLRDSGHEVLGPERAQLEGSSELHVGLLNMMPDAALGATEYQFMSLVGSSQRNVQFYVYPFSLVELERGDQALAHIEKYYFEFDELKERGLDALIITGANVINPALNQEAFWVPLMNAARWAERNVSSILCSCLATHALLNFFHGIEREPLGFKRWGVYSHQVRDPAHPLTRNIDANFDAPHSRFNAVTRSQLEGVGLQILVDSPDAGVHMAASPDGLRTVYFQGHPEYDTISLLKEFKREIARFLNDELDAPPPWPENYLSTAGERVAKNLLDACVASKEAGASPPQFPEAELEKYVSNSWRKTAETMIDNWLDLVVQAKSGDRT